MILPYVLLGLGAALLTFVLTALVCDWSERRQAIRESESLSRMVQGDQRTAEVIQLWPRGD